MSKGILFSQMIPPTGDLDRFNTWYNEDHIPVRMALPHFERAARYAPEEGGEDYLAIYEVNSLEAFETPGYLQVKRSPSEETESMLNRVSGFTRYICEEIGDSGSINTEARYLSVVAFAVPEENDQEFNAWYATEHVPMLLEATDWLRVRRYRVRDGVGGPWTHIALHELASLEVMNSPERARAKSGPLREALVERPWFARSGRWLYRSLGSQSAYTFQESQASGARIG